MLYKWFYIALIIIVNIVSFISAQELIEEEQVVWCTTNLEEQYKCQNFTKALERDKALFRRDFLNLKCKQAFNAEECMTMLDEEKAHLLTLDPGDVFVAGRYNSLIPIMQEQYDGGFNYYYTVAVVKTGTIPEIQSLSQLRGAKACFAGVGSLAGWVVPVLTLMKRGGMKVVDCNNHVKSAIEFFGPSCAVNSLIDRYNPIGDNSDKLCSICAGKVAGGKCTRKDPYAGFEGAFRCLLEAGDIAFLKHTTVNQMLRSKEFNTLSADRFELFCTDGTRRPLTDYRTCNWGNVPSHAVVTSSAHRDFTRLKYQKFLKKATEMYAVPKAPIFANNQNQTGQNNFNNPSGNRFDTGRGFENPGFDNRFDNNRFDENRFDNSGFNNNQNNYSSINYNTTYNSTTFPYGENNYDINSDNFNSENRYNASADPRFYEHYDLFESMRYRGGLNLMFQDDTTNLIPLPENQQTHIGYLGEATNLITEIRQCPVNRMTLCVTSDPEMDKCVKMRTALKAQFLKPEMSCYKGHSQIHCMQAIQSGVADVTVLDASDVYTAGLKFDLVPFISEVYNLGEPEYFVVAVAKEEDHETELTYLKGKYTCHSGINTAAGWIYPMAYLISNGWIRSYGCDSVRAAAEYFTKSCIPGALSTEYNTGVPYDNMCDLCHGASYRYCRRDASEDYYGHTGALRCLVEGGGHVAFVKHTTVYENSGGKRREWWARNTLNDDFELLCPDGTRADIHEYRRCNLGKVKANAVVARGGYAYNETLINAYINLFIYSQQFYGRKDHDDFSFSMFYSIPPYSDLIFQDATQQLRVIEASRRRYDLYLGNDFMRARRIVDCQAGAGFIKHIGIASMLALAVVVRWI